MVDLNEEEEVEMSNAEESETDESDKELQLAFQKGLLKPGLNVVQQVIKKKWINNASGLKASLLEFKKDLDWIERLDVTVARTTEQDDEGEDEKAKTTEDDFRREMTFIEQAQHAVEMALPMLHKLKVATKRPGDYFAEMVKSDQQMKKVRANLLTLQVAKQRSEAARRLREEKKFATKIQKDVAQERRDEKKQLMEAVKKHKKGIKNRLNDIIDRRKPDSDHPKVGKKRAFRDSKFGYGGQKKRSKSNTAESAADFSSFDASKFNKGPSKSGGRQRGGAKRPNRSAGGKKPRLGKSRRALMKNKKSQKRK